VRQRKRIGRIGARIVLSGMLVLMAWKCGEGYQEYRSASRVVDSLAAACKISGEEPCFSPRGWGY
jgi:hypothetical protein